MSERAPQAAVAETHISTVFFTGDRAYKILKPIRTAFLDYSTPELRGRACALELELNRRIAPDVYLGVSPILEHGEVAEHVLVMRRLPAERRLTALLHTGERDDAIRAVARTVAAFHAAQAPSDAAARLASAEAVRDLWVHNLDEMRELGEGILPAAELAEVRTLAERYVAGRGELFAHRIAEGRARDGHGDLLADDIFVLDDGPRILDCLAFDESLRLGDVLLDVAFLAMDIERLADRETAASFLRWYQEFSAEQHPSSLAHHYVAYRALVRAKVACIRASQGGDAVAAARDHLTMAAEHLRAGRARMVLVGGAPGTGKTTTAAALADRTGFVLLSSDEQRKDLAGLGHRSHAFAGLNEGIYGADMSHRTYDALLDRARLVLGLGESVILDASWGTASRREIARAVARSVHADLVELRCELDPNVAAARVARRLELEDTTSDATPALARQLAAAMDPWPEAVPLDARRPPAEVVHDASAAVGEW